MNKKLFIILGFVTLLAGGVFWLQQSQERQIVPTPQSSSENEPIDTSDWKTYRNEELGIEFKYPDKLKVSQPNIDENYFVFSGQDNQKSKNEDISFEIIAYKRLEKKKIEQVTHQDLLNQTYVPYLTSGNIQVNIRDEERNAVHAKLVEYKFREEPSQHNIESWINGYEEKEVFFQCKKGVCSLKTFSNHFSVEKENILLQIVSSLSLINSAD